MHKFSDIRSDAIRKKNEIYIKSSELGNESEAIVCERKLLEDTRSRIPVDLPDDVKSLIDERMNGIAEELKAKSESISEKIDAAQDEADVALEEMRTIGNDLGEKGESLINRKDIPLIGSFLESKGIEMMDQKEQMYDLAKETQKYSDSLAKSGIKITNR